jgi:hypothetical protein
MLVEATAFMPLKRLLKQWIQRNAEAATLLNRRTKIHVTISEETLATLPWDFDMATGYFSKSMIANTDMLSGFMQMLMQNPQAQADLTQFDLGKLIMYLLSVSGVKQGEQFKRTPQQPQQLPPQQVPLDATSAIPPGV